MIWNILISWVIYLFFEAIFLGFILRYRYEKHSKLYDNTPIFYNISLGYERNGNTKLYKKWRGRWLFESQIQWLTFGGFSRRRVTESFEGLFNIKGVEKTRDKKLIWLVKGFKKFYHLHILIGNLLWGYFLLYLIWLFIT